MWQSALIYGDQSRGPEPDLQPSKLKVAVINHDNLPSSCQKGILLLHVDREASDLEILEEVAGRCTPPQKFKESSFADNYSIQKMPDGNLLVRINIMKVAYSSEEVTEFVELLRRRLGHAIPPGHYLVQLSSVPSMLGELKNATLTLDDFRASVVHSRYPHHSTHGMVAEIKKCALVYFAESEGGGAPQPPPLPPPPSTPPRTQAPNAKSIVSF